MGARGVLLFMWVSVSVPAFAEHPKRDLEKLSERPTLDFTSDKNRYEAGERATLKWTSSNTRRCRARGDWRGRRPTEGSFTTPPLDANSIFKLRCRGPAGRVVRRLRIRVEPPTVTPAPQPEPIPPPPFPEPPQAPTVSLSVDNTHLASGSATTVRWSSSSATSCHASGDWTGSQAVNGRYDTGGLFADHTYELTCDGLGGRASDKVTVEVESPPTVSLEAESVVVSSGSPANLFWASSGADRCTASGGWEGDKPVDGSQRSDLIEDTTTFTLTCVNDFGTESASVTVGVNRVEEPSVEISADRTSVGEGESVNVSWTSAHVDSCNASGDWSGSKLPAGSYRTAALRTTSTFTINCDGPGGRVSDTVAVSVSTPPTVSIAVGDQAVDVGANTTLSWSSRNADRCTASGGWEGPQTLNGMVSVGPIDTATSFSLTCEGPSGTAVAIASVGVNARLTVNWQPPTENTDGSQVTTLMWYRILWGTTSGSYSDQVTVDDGARTSHTLAVPPGDYYVVMTVTDDTGQESAYSNEVKLVAQ